MEISRVTFVCCVAVLWLQSGALAQHDEYMMEEPGDQTIREGDTVRLPCILRRSITCNMYWYRLDMQTYISMNDELMRGIPSEFSSRYAVVGNASKGDFTLQISNATAWDGGQYECACYGPVHRFSSYQARVIVLVAPPDEYPQCEIRKLHGLLMPGDEVELVCRSRGGSPAVRLQWFNGNVNLPSDMSWDYETVATHRAIVSLDENLSHYYCKASGEALEGERSCNVSPVTVIAPPSVQIDSNINKVWQEFERGTLPLVGGEPRSQDMVELSFTCGPSTNFSRDVNNFTWYVNDDPITPGMFGFIVENNGRTLRITDLTILYSALDMEIVCELTNNGWPVSNSSTIVSLNSNVLANPTGPPAQPYTTEQPDIFIHTHRGKWRLWPIWLLIICVLMSLFLLILLAIYAPVMCGCKKRKEKKHDAHCHHTAAAPSTKASSQISEFHYMHSQGCSTLRTSRDTLNVYELPESERGGVDPQRQQVQATLHVVVHSANHAPPHTPDSPPVLTTAETIVSSDYGMDSCQTPSMPRAVSNFYHPELGHYQKVRPGARPACYESQTMLSVPPSPKPQPPTRKDSLEPHYQHPRSHACCMNQTWGHNPRQQRAPCHLATPTGLSPNQPDVTEGCYVRTLPHPPNEVKQAKLVFVDGGIHDMQGGNTTFFSDAPFEDGDNIYENIAGEEGERGNKQTLV